MQNNSDNIKKRLEFLQSKKIHNKYWNISWNLGEILSNLVSIQNPQNTLELGTSNGFSTLWIAKSIKDNSKIYTIDVNEARLNEAKLNFNLCNLKNIIPLQGEILDLLENYTFKSKFDFIFLDAAHKYYKEVIQKLEEKNLLNNDCLIVADNVLSHDYMENFINWMKTKYNCEIIEMDSGFLVAKNSLKN